MYVAHQVFGHLIGRPTSPAGKACSLCRTSPTNGEALK